MLRVTYDEDPDTWRLKLEGKLAGDWTTEAERIWDAAPSDKPREVDLRGLTCADETGRQLLHRMHREGVHFIAEGVAMKALIQALRREGADGAAMAVRLVAAILVVLLASAATAYAQAGGPDRRETASTPLRLTLQQAVVRGLQQSPEIVIANLNLAVAQERKSAARGALLPQIALNANEKVTRASLEAAFGKKVPGFPDHTGPFWAVQAGAGGTAAIFDLGLWNQWRAAHEGVDAAVAQQETARELNAQLVVSQYLGCLRAAADVDAVRTRLDLAKALLDQAMDMQRNGVGTSLDSLRANVEYQNERQRRTEAEAQFAIALQGLRRLLSLDPDRPIELADAASFFETPAIDVDASLERAFTHRPELRAVLAETRAAERFEASAKSQRLPTLWLAGGWSYEGLRPDTAIPTYQFGAYVSMPLFAGGRIGADIATRGLEVRKLTEGQRQLRDQIGYEVRTATTRLEASRSEVEAANLGASLAREALNQAQDRFRAGVANNIEVVTAQDELSRANDNQIRALYRYNQARADLARSTGQMETLYAH